MKSYPTWEQVAADLGDKFVAAVADSVSDTRRDLGTYRGQFPLWVAEATERGLASWLHDRLWFHLISRVGDSPAVQVVDEEPRREFGVGSTYALRIKRHHEDGRVSTYPTVTATDFLLQLPQEPFDGHEQWNLIAGYTWLKELRQVGAATISLRDGRKILWQADIDGGSVEEGGSGIVRPVKPKPTLPEVNVQGDEERERSEDGE